jgi:hypothetical protein
MIRRPLPAAASAFTTLPGTVAPHPASHIEGGLCLWRATLAPARLDQWGDLFEQTIGDLLPMEFET